MSVVSEPEQTLQRLAAVYGDVGEGLRLLTEIDPEFASALTDFVGASSMAASLEPRLRQLLLLAHDVSITNLDEEGARNRVLMALRAGATEREITAVIELVTMVSLHGLTRGFPLLEPRAAEPQQEGTPGEGYWESFEAAFPGFHRRMKDANPAAFASYRAMGKHIWKNGGLDPAWSELVFIVVDLSNTHLFTEGAALHIRNALHYGATRQQVLDAVLLTVPSIVRSIDMGFNAVRDGLALFRQEDPPPMEYPR